MRILQLLVLMTLANGTPIVAKKIFGPRFSFPLDADITFFDGRPLFGPSKTIRGILISVLITTASAPLIGLDLTIGAIVAGVAMAGTALPQRPPAAWRTAGRGASTGRR